MIDLARLETFIFAAEHRSFSEAARFCMKYPGIQISILACTPEHIMPRLLEGEANLGVVSSYDYCQGDFECQEFFNDSIALIVSNNHPFAQRPFP